MDGEKSSNWYRKDLLGIFIPVESGGNKWIFYGPRERPYWEVIPYPSKQLLYRPSGHCSKSLTFYVEEYVRSGIKRYIPLSREGII